MRSTGTKIKYATFEDRSASPDSQNKKRRENDFVPSAPTGIIQNKKFNNKKLDKFSVLAENKIELVNAMLDSGKEKHELEIQILKMQLQKETLQVAIMQKELDLKTLILEREQRRLY